MPDSPIPPLVDLSRKADSVASWARFVQVDLDAGFEIPKLERERLSIEIDALEQAIVRARGVL